MASFAKPRFTKSLKAAGDLDDKQFYYVGDNGSDEYAVAGHANGAIGGGFLMNKPLEGEFCEVASIGGGALGVAGEAVSGPNLELKAIADGTLNIADTAGDVVCAISKESAATSDVFEVEPVLYRKHA